MKVIMFVLRFGVGVALAGFCFAAFAAFLGFASPLLDALNHLQPIWFTGTLVLLIFVAATFHTHPWRAGLLALGASGFLASAVIVIPEQLGGIFVRPISTQGQQTYKLMSHNLFGLNEDMARVANIIHEEAPDIIALQEFFEEQRAGLHPRIIGDYPYFASCAGRKGAQIALYSKMPFEVIEGTQCAQDSAREDNPVARLVTKFQSRDGNDFNVVTTHLNWPVQVRPLFRDDLSWSEKLAAVPARKQLEWAELSAAINGLTGPIVLAGDFNSTSWSYAMRQFVRGTELTRHSHGLLTYPTIFYIKGWRKVPALVPIDHLMASADVQVQQVVRGGQTGSDHLPIYGVFSLSEEAKN